MQIVVIVVVVGVVGVGVFIVGVVVGVVVGIVVVFASRTLRAHFHARTVTHARAHALRKRSSFDRDTVVVVASASFYFLRIQRGKKQRR